MFLSRNVLSLFSCDDVVIISDMSFEYAFGLSPFTLKPHYCGWLISRNFNLIVVFLFFFISILTVVAELSLKRSSTTESLITFFHRFWFSNWFMTNLREGTELIFSDLSVDFPPAVTFSNLLICASIILQIPVRIRNTYSMLMALFKNESMQSSFSSILNLLSFSC